MTCRVSVKVRGLDHSAQGHYASPSTLEWSASSRTCPASTSTLKMTSVVEEVSASTVGILPAHEALRQEGFWAGPPARSPYPSAAQTPRSRRNAAGPQT